MVAQIRKKKIQPVQPSLTTLNFNALNRQLNAAKEQEEEEGSVETREEKQSLSKIDSEGQGRRAVTLNADTLRQFSKPSNPRGAMVRDDQSAEVQSNRSS